MTHTETLTSAGNTAHSTTSPRASPQLDLLNSTSQMSSPRDDDISVTASSKGSPPPDDRPGAFTTVLKSKNSDLNSLLTKKNQELMQKNPELSGILQHSKNMELNAFQHASQHPHGNLFNNALAAQLFLNTPLLQPPNQWLYSQLYQGGYEWPWLHMRHPSLAPSNPVRARSTSPDPIRVEESSQESIHRDDDTPEDKSTNDSVKSQPKIPNGINLSKKKGAKDLDSANITSSKRSSSPLLSNTRGKSGAERNVTTRHSDVWRPY